MRKMLLLLVLILSIGCTEESLESFCSYMEERLPNVPNDSPKEEITGHVFDGCTGKPVQGVKLGPEGESVSKEDGSFSWYCRGGDWNCNDLKIYDAPEGYFHPSDTIIVIPEWWEGYPFRIFPIQHFSIKIFSDAQNSDLKVKSIFLESSLNIWNKNKYKFTTFQTKELKETPMELNLDLPANSEHQLKVILSKDGEDIIVNRPFRTGCSESDEIIIQH